MEIRICPDCNRAFYTQRDKVYIVCPHCSYILHDRRVHKRVKKSIDFTFINGGERRKATIKDYSEDGVRIVYKGSPMPFDTIFTIDIEELNIHRKAKTIWTKTISPTIKATGLRLL